MNQKIRDTGILTLAIQRDPSFILKVLHELSRSEDSYPDLMSIGDISRNECVVSSMDIDPRVIDYHLHGPAAIRAVIDEVKPVIPWIGFYYSNVMLSLYRGFFPKLFSPNTLYTFMSTRTEKYLLSFIDSGAAGLEGIMDAMSRVTLLKEAVEDMWRLQFGELKIRVGPIPPQDLLATISAYDDMIVLHPSAPLSPYWPGIVVYKLARLLLMKHYPRMRERFKDQLALLTVLATVGEALPVPGAFYTELSRHPIDHAQYQITLISKDLKLCNDFDYKLIHFLPNQGMDESFSVDMISSLIIFIVEEEEIYYRDLFARISASNVGFKSFRDDFLFYQKVIPRLEKLGVLKRGEEANKIILSLDAPQSNEI
ncbi:MAG: hypothetical protein ACTSU9_06995 [Promethearchaeota archaeon]